MPDEAADAGDFGDSLSLGDAVSDGPVLDGSQVGKRLALNAAIAQAEAKLRASEAMRRQVGNNLTAQVIADIAIIRDAGRQLDLFDNTILPRARQVVSVARTAFETGDASQTDAASLLNLLDDQRSLIAIERLAAKLRITQATYLAELESITTSDLTRPPPADKRAEAR